MTREINKEFTIVFQPSLELFGYGELLEMFNLTDRKYRRFAIGAGTLPKMIGEENANKTFSRALDSKDDRYTRLHRKFGRIDFYVK